MTPETYPLLRRLREGQFENCVILTFNADLAFYEQVVLSTLRSRGCYNNFVFMDLKQYAVSLECSQETLQGLGRLYSIWPVSAPASFHPKIILLCGDSYGRLVIGSGNLTVRGLSSNWEIFSEIERSGPGPNDELFHQAWDFVQSLAQDAPSAVANQIRQVNETCAWLTEGAAKNPWPRLLVGRPGGVSLTQQLKDAIGNRSIRRLIVVAPFFDRRLMALNELRRTLAPKEVALIVQPAKVSLPGEALAGLDHVSAYRFQAGAGSKAAAAYLHAKIYIIETGDAEYCLWGSPNCSRSALAPAQDEGNVEVALLGKGKKGYFLSLLGLSGALSHSAIDPTVMTWRDDEKPSTEPSLQIASADADTENIEVRLANRPVARKDSVGRLVFTMGSNALPEIKVTRTGDGIYKGRWASVPNLSRTVLCRLVLGSNEDRVESSPAAVNFLSILAKETPSKTAANMRRLLRKIEVGSGEWAQGLEGVYEVLFKLETTAMDSAARRIVRKGKRKADADEAEEVRAYEKFVSDPKSGAKSTGPAGLQSGLLVEFVRMLGTRLLQGVQEEELENAEDTDSWKYREEMEKDTADTGEKTQEVTDEENIRLHGLVRRGYIRLMKALAQRYERMRDQQILATADEALRLFLVSTLCVEATGRIMKEVSACGPILCPEDLAEYLLPAVSILFGRVKNVQKPSGPLLAAASLDPKNEHLREAAIATCILLSGLVGFRKSLGRVRFADQNEEVVQWNSYCTEIIAARSFGLLEQKDLLPTTDQLRAVVAHFEARSPWLSALRADRILNSFDELCNKSRAIMRIEAKPPKVGPGIMVPPFHEGDWVYSPISGVTEVLGIEGKNAILAMVGGHYDDGSLEKKVASAFVWPVGISRSRDR